MRQAYDDFAFRIWVAPFGLFSVMAVSSRGAKRVPGFGDHRLREITPRVGSAPVGRRSRVTRSPAAWDSGRRLLAPPPLRGAAWLTLVRVGRGHGREDVAQQCSSRTTEAVKPVQYHSADDGKIYQAEC